MEIYRTCAAPKKSVNEFLNTAAEISSVSYLNYGTMVDEIFSRSPSYDYWSRFCPRGGVKIPLYVADNPRTTFFEYGYHLIKNSVSIAGKFLNVALYDLQALEPLVNCADISADCPPGVLEANDSEYIEAHKFLSSLNPFPASIRYRSARDPAPGICFAIFEKTVLAPIVPAMQIYQAKVREEKLIDLVDPDGTVRTLKIPGV